MKPIWCYVILAALTGLGSGYWLRGSGQAGNPVNEEAGERHATKVSSRLDRPIAYGSGPERLRRELRAAKSDQLPDLVYRVLQIADPLERKEMLLEALKKSDASNSLAIINEFERITRETGRIQPDIWRMALFAAGRKDGAHLLDVWKAEGKEASSAKVRVTLEGWAFESPQAAMAWLDESDHARVIGRELLYGSVLSGAVLHDIDQGIKMMAEVPVAERRACIGDFTWSLVQNGGLDRAVEWMLEVQRTSAATESEYARAVENEVFSRITGASEGTSGAKEAAARLLQIHRVRPISNEQIVRSVSKMQGTWGLDLIAQLAATPVLSDPGATDQALFSVVSHKPPQVMRKWLDENPSSPLNTQIESQLAKLGSTPTVK
jgi:hypothetical protein